MGYKEEERVQVRLEFLKMVSRMRVNPAEMALLYGFFDTYLKLNDKEEAKMREEISQLPKNEADKVLELPNYYYDKGVKEGVERGIEEGIERGRERGIEQGIERGIEQVVYKMLANGFTDEMIQAGTGLSLGKLAEMRRKQDKS